MNRYEYMRIPVQHILDGIMQQYPLTYLVANGFVMVEIWKGMHGLPQAGIIANNQFQKHLAKSDYFPRSTIPGLYKHKIFDTTLTLVVDDFGIKYTNKEDFLPLLNCLWQF